MASDAVAYSTLIGLHVVLTELNQSEKNFQAFQTSFEAIREITEVNLDTFTRFKKKVHSIQIEEAAVQNSQSRFHSLRVNPSIGDDEMKLIRKIEEVLVKIQNLKIDQLKAECRFIEKDLVEKIISKAIEIFEEVRTLHHVTRDIFKFSLGSIERFHTIVKRSHEAYERYELFKEYQNFLKKYSEEKFLRIPSLEGNLRAFHGLVSEEKERHMERHSCALRIFQSLHSFYLEERAVCLIKTVFPHPIINMPRSVKEFIRKELTGVYIEDFGKKIAEGAYGQVYAVSICGKRYVKKVVTKTESAKRIALDSALLAKQLHAPKYFTQAPFIQHDGYLMERADMDLCRLIRADKVIVKKNWHHFFMQLIHAFRILERNQLVYTDLKLDNVLVFFKKNGFGIDHLGVDIKIADFDSIQTMRPKKYVCNFITLPPETFIYSSKELLFTQKANSWRLGMMFYTMLFGRDLYHDLLKEDHISSKESVKDKILEMTQEEIQSAIKHHLGMIQFRMDVSELNREEFFMQVGKKTAHKKLIQIGKSVVDHPKYQEIRLRKKIEKEEKEYRYRQFLLECGMKEFIDRESKESLRKLFIDEGTRKYFQTHSKEEYVLSMQKIIDKNRLMIENILLKLLQIEARDRLTPEELYREVIEPLELIPDEIVGEFSFEELSYRFKSEEEAAGYKHFV
jgi:serine/threonine protein kinase